MLIEIFTDGRVLIDGQAPDASYKAEKVLFDYLTHPQGFTSLQKKNKKAA